MYASLRKRYENEPRWMAALAADVAAGLLLLLISPYLIWQSVLGIRLKRCENGKHRYRATRVDRTLTPVEWRCRTCERWKWFEQGKERNTQPPWYG